MKEISNSTLAMLVVVAIVVSVFGTLISISKLGDMGLTGMLSANNTALGKANLTIQETTYINATDNVIELGTIASGYGNASDNVDDWWVIRNDGSVNISLRFYAHEGDQQEKDGYGPFTGSGTSGCTQTGSNLTACFMVNCKNSSNGGETTGYYCNNTYWGLSNDRETARYIIEWLAPGDENDTAWFGANATVPIGQGAGVYQQIVEFYSTASI